MAAVSIPTFIDDSNEYVSEKAFTTEEKSSWKHYRSKFVMFQAIFASVIFSIKGDGPAFHAGLSNHDNCD